MNQKKISMQHIILIFTFVLFVLFLFLPMLMILIKSFSSDGSITLEHYIKLFKQDGILKSFGNSVLASSFSGIITTVLAFIPAYAINYTNIKKGFKRCIAALVMLPMLLPTVTYGFAIIYSFGKQGMITRLLGGHFIDIYGIKGVIIGYVIYTLPISFMLINNTMGYVDKEFTVVSRIMGDSKLKNFWLTVITPLISTFAVSFIQSFTLSFTDYGIPAALAGNVDLLPIRLYNEMLGSIPDFNTGSAVSIIMLLPSGISIILITILNRYNIRYDKISEIELSDNRVRDYILGAASALIIVSVLSVFAVIFIVPFVDQWPYQMNLSMHHVKEILSDDTLMDVYSNSIFVSFATAVFGTVIVYGAALISARHSEIRHYGRFPDAVSLVTNTIPGMVLGVAYLLFFKGSFLHNTFAILIICNIVHYFSSPYLMMKSSLEKLNASWETTARLMGDSWIETVVRIITPNAISTLLEVFGYFFVNAMITISAVIFIAGTRTMIITSKIMELQHFANFNEIFVLSILVLITNLIVKGLIKLFAKLSKPKGV